MKRLFLGALILLSIVITATAAESNTIRFAYRNGDFEDLDWRSGRCYRHRGQVFISRSTLRKLNFDGALATIMTKDYGWLYVRRDGATRRTIFFDNGPDYFVEGLARYTTGLISGFDPKGKVGFINQHGDIVIPAQFEWASPFEHGYSVVCNGCHQVPDGEYHFLAGGQWGCMDKNGNVIIPVMYSEHEIYSKVSALPSLTTKWTPSFKDGTIGLEIKNTGDTPLQFQPTPVSHTIPSLAYEHEHGLSPFTPDERHDIIVPVITIVGSTFDDDRLLADNGRYDMPISLQPNATKTMVISLNMSAENLAKMCDHVIISLFFNNARIYNKVYKVQMKRDESGVWNKE